MMELSVEVDIEVRMSVEELSDRTWAGDAGDKSAFFEGHDATSSQNGCSILPARAIKLDRKSVDRLSGCEDHHGVSPSFGGRPDLVEKRSCIGLSAGSESDDAGALTERLRYHHLIFL